MKLTKEQELYIRNQIAFKTNHLVDEKVAEVVKLIEGMPEGQPEPNTTRWYHCSERLPMEADSDSAGYVHTWEQGKVYRFTIEGIEDRGDLWWTPVPKNLVKPTPPDPFEQFMKEFSNVDFTTHNLTSREWLRKAYLLGRSQTKQ